MPQLIVGALALTSIVAVTVLTALGQPSAALESVMFALCGAAAGVTVPALVRTRTSEQDPPGTDSPDQPIQGGRHADR